MTVVFGGNNFIKEIRFVVVNSNGSTIYYSLRFDLIHSFVVVHIGHRQMTNADRVADCSV